MPWHAESGLIRSIRKWDLIAVTVNAVIGAGIFGLPSKVYSLAGDYSLFGFLLCAAFAAMIVLCFAEVGSRFTETGGPYLYAREAFGPGVGFETGFLMWVVRVAAFAADFNLMIAYVGYFWPGATGSTARALIITATLLVLAAINIRGVRNA